MIDTALAKMERGEDVPELGVHLPPGILEHHWGQLRMLHALIVQRRALRDAATEHHFEFPTAEGAARAFLDRGLSGLPRNRSLDAKFTRRDARDIKRHLSVERRRADHQSQSLGKMDRALALGDEAHERA